MRSQWEDTCPWSKKQVFSRNPIFQWLDLGLSGLQNCEKYISAIYKPPSIWKSVNSCINALNTVEKTKKKKKKKKKKEKRNYNWLWRGFIPWVSNASVCCKWLKLAGHKAVIYRTRGQSLVSHSVTQMHGCIQLQSYGLLFLS